MAEFDLNRFANAITTYLRAYFPYMVNEDLDKEKHPKRNPLHIKDAIFNNLQMFQTIDTITFDIGNPRLEMTHPYYHILEDSEVIQIREKGTVKSKGSQDKITDAKARDYGIVKWNGKTFSQEYRKNVRGARSRARKGRQSIVVVGSNAQVFRINTKSTYYTNIHYHYIENIIDRMIPLLSESFGLKPRRKESTGLGEEYIAQGQDENGIGVGNILEIFDSFNY